MMTSLRRKIPPSALTFEAEPFQGFTEFDEFEGFDSEESDEWSDERQRRLAGRRPARSHGRPQGRPRKRRPGGRFFPAFRIPFASLNIFPDTQAAGAPDDAGATGAATDDGADDGADLALATDQSEYDEWEWLDPEAFEFEESFEWMEEVSRSSPEYIRWAQQSLNQIM